MILKAPTGLYRALLPMTPESEPGSVIFTLSNQDPPPPSAKIIPKVPSSVTSNPLPTMKYKILDDRDARGLFGPRIKSVISGTSVQLRDGKKLFEAGESIDFVDDTSVSPRGTPDEIETRHDTNLLDLEGAGLTQSEIDEVVAEAERVRAGLQGEITTLQASEASMRVEMAAKQRSINETRKAIRSLGVIYGIPDGTTSSGNDKYDRLVANLEVLNAERDALVEDINQANTDIAALHERLLRISEVTR